MYSECLVCFNLHSQSWILLKHSKATFIQLNKKRHRAYQNDRDSDRLTYEGCSKSIASFYLETSNFKLAQKYSFHALEVLPVARNAKFQPMYPLLEGITVR